MLTGMLLAIFFGGVSLLCGYVAGQNKGKDPSGVFVFLLGAAAIGCVSWFAIGAATLFSFVGTPDTFQNAKQGVIYKTISQYHRGNATYVLTEQQPTGEIKLFVQEKEADNKFLPEFSPYFTAEKVEGKITMIPKKFDVEPAAADNTAEKTEK